MKRLQPPSTFLGCRSAPFFSRTPSLFPSATATATASAFLVLLGMAMTAGCSPAPTSPGMPKRVPFGGTVKVDGKPLVGAVVVFNPEDTRTGTVTQSDTDEDGKYELQYNSFPGGTAPGVYKVMISYLVAPDGAPQTMGARSALQMPDSLLHAKERLPKKYSDLGHTELTVTVPPEGGTHHFDLTGPLLPPAEPPAAKPDAGGGAAKPEDAVPDAKKDQGEAAAKAKPESSDANKPEAKAKAETAPTPPPAPLPDPAASKKADPKSF